jgi:hypothetical protein
MPGWPRGFGDYNVRVSDSQLAAYQLEMTGEWR